MVFAIVSAFALSQPLSAVTLYFCDLAPQGVSQTQLQQLRLWLPDDEQAKADRFLQPDARVKGLLVRSYLRAILSQCARDMGVEIAPAQWQFTYLDRGKPVLSRACFARCPLLFNISHSGDYLLVAIANANHWLSLGVDIERQRESTNIYPILNHYFTRDETDSLLGLPQAQQRARFFDLWALKESYIKAKGLGLALSLKSFSFAFEPRQHDDAMKAQSTWLPRGTPPEYMQIVAYQQDSATDCQPQVDNQACARHVLREGMQAKIERNITLLLHEEQGKRLSDSWQLVLGHLDAQYRFALSLEHVEAQDAKPVSKDKLTLRAMQLNVQQLLHYC
ncbi:4'-phosphopantetheinyl transferase [Shewanella algidipiscicola]|uniref:4'-phosphopantetheinyl transferase n=1 Tax=Shewanella algidipiscicola TaxID=614070 RepID=A0ABQ4NT17_9GAMM|nr:4'-phosphopantetheinyl transferase [Shewanella algidipiscicola]